MKIFIIGQCSLHWGRMEFGNIGNYYIIEPLVRELYTNFPKATIKTTFQMSKRFCEDENVEVLPLELYYDFTKNNLDDSLKELASAYIYSKTGVLPYKTNYINEVLTSDLVIDFSGDMWGDNSNFLGQNRFLIGLIKDRIAQLLNKKTVMLAGSPGPFFEQNTLEFAKEVYKNFDLVTNRESISINLLKNLNFDVSKTESLSCPAFLFEPNSNISIEHVETLKSVTSNLKIGFILCGWNFKDGPFDKWPREDSEYEVFVNAIEYISETLGGHVVLLSHSNGFLPPPSDFKLINGRDFLISKQLYDILQKRGIAKNISLVTEVLDSWQTKKLIGTFDMLVSGRIHGAVAGLSQNVPTVIIDYGHEPKAHKLKGFAIEANVVDCVSNPNDFNDVIDKILYVFNNLSEFRTKLKNHIPNVKKKSKRNFELLKQLVQ